MFSSDVKSFWVEEGILIIFSCLHHNFIVSVDEGGTAGSSGQTSDSQVDSDSSQQPQQQREVGGSRPPRISRTPIVWSATSDVTQPAPQLELQARPQGSAAAVRGASARCQFQQNFFMANIPKS